MDKSRPGSQPRIRLTEARNARGLSQQEVADSIGTTYVNVSRWERGITRPTPFFRRKLCTLYSKTELELDLAQEGDIPPDVSGVAPNPHTVMAEPSQFPQALTPLTPYIEPGALYDPSIPLPPAIHLVGRDEELARLKQRLRSGGSVALTALNGLPGVGKTTLSITLAHDPEMRAHFKDGVLWAGLGPNPNMQGHLSRWSTLLGMSASEMSGLSNTEAWAVALRRAIGSRTMLLVIDDAWTLEDALTLKVGGPNCVHLVTTRFPYIATQIATDGAMAIKELSSEEGMVLLRMLAPQVVEKEVQRARDLVMVVGGLPLALNLIGNYLRMQSYTGQSRRITSALQRLNDAGERLNISEPRGPAERHPSLPIDTPVSLRSVIAVTDQQLDEEASGTLHALAIFPSKPNSFSEEAALAVANCGVDILDELTDTGLLESSGSDRYTLHQTIADYARQQLGGYVVHERLIMYITDFVETHRKDYEILEIEINNIFAALESAYKQARHGELTRVACAFAPFLLSRGLYTQVQDHLSRAYNAALVQQDYYGLASILRYLGEMAQKQGDYEQAEQYLQEGLKYAREIGDKERISALLNNLGWVSLKRGEDAQSEIYLQEGLGLARQINDPERTSSLLEMLGSAAGNRGDYQQSEAYIKEGIALARQIDDRERICTMLINLGVTEGEQGNYVLAEEYFQEGLILARQIGHHEWISALCSNLGGLATELGNYKQAEEYFQEGLILARQLGHREWISALLSNLGLVTHKQGNLIQTEEYLQEGLILARQIGRSHIIVNTLYAYGNLCLDKLQPEVAKSIFAEILTEFPEGGQDMIALANYGLARSISMQGDLEEAHKLGEKSLVLLESIGHRSVQDVRDWLDSLPESK